ncbi:MAG: type II toxin-antitoxin system VapC family toxin [bacterium]
MLIVADTSALVAVVVSEPQRAALIRATDGADLVAPGSVHWEVGNALSALLRRRRITAAQAQAAVAAYSAIPVRFLDVDLALALEVAAEHDMYAYDAYLITCALSQKAPLLTLDRGLKRTAHAAGVPCIEVRP